MKKNRYFGRGALTLLAAAFAFLFLMPTVLTITNSFMTQSEIAANYGQVFETAAEGGTSYISEKINLKFIMLCRLKICCMMQNSILNRFYPRLKNIEKITYIII